VEIYEEGQVLRLAHVAAFLELSSSRGTKYFALVHYLEPEFSDEQFEKRLFPAPRTGNNTNAPMSAENAPVFFRRYKYSMRYNPGLVFHTMIVEIESIMGPAYVVEDFSTKTNIWHESRFNYVPRRFTDRSGWELTTSELSKFGINIDVVDVLSFVQAQSIVRDDVAATNENESARNARKSAARRSARQDIAYDVGLFEEDEAGSEYESSDDD
jgi:hypothetical protein